MPLDRAFSLSGVDKVVAGSISAGTVRMGDTLCLAHARDRILRVRSLQTHGSTIDVVGGGHRCSNGLPGLAREDVQRGQNDDRRVFAAAGLETTTTARPTRPAQVGHMKPGCRRSLAIREAFFSDSIQDLKFELGSVPPPPLALQKAAPAILTISRHPLPQGI